MKTTGMVLGIMLSLTASTALAGANRTAYPIVFAHGMGGFDDIVGYDYWGDDWGVFVLDPCDEFLEVTCNRDISTTQRSYVSAVQPFQSSEVRGLQLANNIESYMASSGASYVNIVSHSQGGIDARKAAAVLRARRGYRTVAYHISISSPHRGSPVAQWVLRDFGGTVAETVANYFGNVVYRSGNDIVAALKQLIYNDYSATDGVVTGMAAFNQNYPVNSSSHIARYRSLMTAQQGSNLNPIFWLTSALGYHIDGDGYCVGDGDNDGAGGCGDGNLHDTDDDGLVGINSQQMGYRLSYSDNFWSFDQVYDRTDHGYLSDLNNPTVQQATSHTHVINQDHADVIGVGPDMFDEMEFYAAITDYIADTGY